MDYPEALGRVLGGVEHLSWVRATKDDELLRQTVDQLIKSTEEIRSANASWSQGIIEKIDAKIKVLLAQ